MATGGNDDRPRLPDTDDPFALLGVTPAVDAKAIRQAYARLIRIYRPDRAPVEFQRIHAAFEELQHLQPPSDVRVAVAPADDRGPDSPPPDGESPRRADADAERAQIPRLDERLAEAGALLERGDRAGAAALVDALLDERVPLDLLGSPAHVHLVANHPTLSWTRLAHASRDLDAIRTLWEVAWAAAFEHDHERAWGLLDDDRLRLDAADRPELAAACLLRIGALAWKLGRRLDPVLDRYRDAVPMHPRLDLLFDSIGLDLAAAAQVRRLHLGVASHLPALLTAARAGTREQRRAAARDLLAALTRDLDATLRDLDGLADSLDLGTVFEVIYEHLPVAVTRLDRMEKARFDDLTGALHDVGREPRKWAVLGGVLGATVLAGAGGGLLVGIGVAMAAVGLLVGTERARYLRHVRPRLARLVTRLPITTWILSRWVRINGKLAGRLSRYDLAIDADSALYTLSMFAAAALVIGELEDDAAHAAQHPPAGA